MEQNILDMTDIETLETTEGTEEIAEEVTEATETAQPDPESISEFEFFKAQNGKDATILAKNLYLSKNPKISRLSTNSLVIGASGSGKTRFVIEPNLLQCNSNYVIHDPSGFLYEKYGNFFKKKGYELKVLDFVNMTGRTEKYNPMAGATTQPDRMQRVEEIVDILTAKDKAAEPHFYEAENMLMRAIFMYAYETMGNKANISAAMEEFRSEDTAQTMKEKFDEKFESLAKNNPDSAAVGLYNSFKQVGEKTFGSILMSIQTRLIMFELRDMKTLTSENTIDMKEFDVIQSVVFVIAPSYDNTFEPLITLFFSQFLRTMMLKKDKCINHVNFIFNDFWWERPIKDLDVALSIGRHKNYGCMLFIANIGQLKNVYSNINPIIGSCDTIEYLGTGDFETAEFVSKLAVYGQKQIITPDMLMSIGANECVVLISGHKPILTKKYDVTKHPEYPEEKR